MQAQAQRMQQWEEQGYGQGRNEEEVEGREEGITRGSFGRLERVEKPYEPWRVAARCSGRPSARATSSYASDQAAGRARARSDARSLDLDVRCGDRLADDGATAMAEHDCSGRCMGSSTREAGAALGEPASVRRARAASRDVRRRRAAPRRLRCGKRAPAWPRTHARASRSSTRSRGRAARRAFCRRASVPRDAGALRRAWRQLPRPRRADEPPRRRGDRGARARARRVCGNRPPRHPRPPVSRTFAATRTIEL